MFRLPKSLVLAAAGAGLFTSFAGEGIACPPRGGGGYRPAYYQPQYYPQAAYQQPACQPQPQITVHPQGQPVLTQQQQLQQQMLGQFPQGQAQVGQGQVGQGQVAQGQFGQQQVQSQFGQAGVQQQSGQQAQFAQPTQQQPAQGGAVQGGGVQGGAATSALNALGSQQGQGQPVGGQQIQSQQTQIQSQGGQQQVQAQPAQPQQVQNAPAATADASTRSAADMALEALLGGGTQSTVAQEAAPAAAIPTGDFSASITNGAQIRLSLRSDNSFSWVATKGDKQSSFQGSFTLAGTALTLLRSDNQKLEGTLTQNAAGFQLKLAGQNDAGLSFVRAGTLASR